MIPRRPLPILIIITLIMAMAGIATAETCQGFINRLMAAGPEDQTTMVDTYLANLPDGNTPVREKGTAHFFYRGEAETMHLAGDMNQWALNLPLTRLGETDLWYLRFECPDDTRLDYKFLRNGNEWLLDPLNPLKVGGGFGTNSELRMPDWPEAPELLATGLERCRIDTYDRFKSPQLGNMRTIKVVVPPNYNPDLPNPVLILLDGLDFIYLGGLGRTLAWMESENPDRPLPICVCIGATEGEAEFTSKSRDLFGRFIMETVIPMISENYNTDRSRSELWGLVAASRAGQFALFLSGSYPGRFGRFLLLSPQIPFGSQYRFFKKASRKSRVYLIWGSFDIPALIPDIETFISTLESENLTYLAKRYNDGHSWGLWRHTLDEGLDFLLAP
jgi:enterochelin esterase-like enzyme